MTHRTPIVSALQSRYPGIALEQKPDRLLITAAAAAIPSLASAMVADHELEFATLVIEQSSNEATFSVHYFFYAPGETELFEVTTRAASNETLPAISDQIHAADWHEREAEDLFGLRFTGHPFLGDFVLHDDTWPEDVAPMRRDRDPKIRPIERGLGAAWRPRRLLDEPGGLVFPVGPVWGDYTEAGLWLLETPGEQIRQAHTRLFYKYRAVEKIAEGQSPDQTLLLAERFSGSAAFAHAWAHCQALEKLSGCQIPRRAEALRVVFAELERMRYHASTIAQLAGATALSVAKAMGQEIEERLLRLTGEVCGHRYLFGIARPGGLGFNPDLDLLARLSQGVHDAAKELARFETLLVNSSSFLDRLEEMGTLTCEGATAYGAVGPVGRASGRNLDLRRDLPYGGYRDTVPGKTTESEGDGYARLRVFFREIAASAALIDRQLQKLPDGPVWVPSPIAPGGALAWVEAPAGAAFHWVRVNSRQTVQRMHIGTPAFRNWHAFHRAIEGAAFQDFPIIQASFGLSVAESDR